MPQLMGAPPFSFPTQSTTFASDGVTPLGGGLVALSGQAPFMGAGPNGIEGINLLQDRLNAMHPDWASNMRFEGNDAGNFKIMADPSYQSAIEQAIGQLQTDPIFSGFVPGQSTAHDTGFAQGALSPLAAATVDPTSGQVTQPSAPAGGKILDYGLGSVGFTPRAGGTPWMQTPSSGGLSGVPMNPGGSIEAGLGTMPGFGGQAPTGWPSGLFPGDFGGAVRYIYGHNLTDPGFVLPTLYSPPASSPAAPIEAPASSPMAQATQPFSPGPQIPMPPPPPQPPSEHGEPSFGGGNDRDGTVDGPDTGSGGGGGADLGGGVGGAF